MAPITRGFSSGQAPQDAPAAKRTPAGRDATLVEAAVALLHADAAVLIEAGPHPTIYSSGSVSESLLGELLSRLARGEQFPQIVAESRLAVEPLPDGRSLAIIAAADARRGSSPAQHELDLFVELAAGAHTLRQTENRRLHAVSDIQQSISAQSPILDVFRSIYERAAEEIDTPTFIAALYDRSSQTARYAFAMQDGVERAVADFPPRPLAGPLAEAIRTGRPQLIDDATALPEAGRAAILGDGLRAVRALLVVPMVHHSEVLGVIEAQSYHPSAFTDDDVYLLSTLANQAAVALDSARLLKDSREQVERLTLLNQVMMAMSQIEDPAGASLRALELILAALPGIDMASAWLVDRAQQGLTRLASSGYPADGYLSDRLSLDAPALVSAVARAGRSQVLHIPLESSLPADSERFVEVNRIQTVIHIPMSTGQRVVGVLTFASRTRRDVDPEEIEFLETLGGQLGGSLEALSLHVDQDAERRRLQTILENLPEAIVIADAAGQISVCNHTAEELWGHSAGAASLEELPQVYGLCHPDGRPLGWRETPLARALLDGVPSTGRELLIRRDDGSELPILSNCVPVPDGQGKPAGAVEVFQNISRLKEIDRLKDDFINTVSHELRTPTTTIRGGALTLLRRGDTLDEGTKRQLLRDMSEEAERLHILVEDLLSLSRSQAGMQLTTEPIIPHRFVNHMILERGPRVGDHPLTVDVPADLPMVEADPFCLEQIFRNLLENAVKFSAGGQRIEIEAAPIEGEVVFSVLDRGTGIPSRDVDRVFEPFYRSDEVINAGAQGAGLGLAVCERFARMQGGRIWAEARPGGGTAFRFTVPSVGEPAADEP
ncbi:MAG TPA: GAF domain-containing protein [Dehalococcoidia bacterium]|nr:GAF domain-containing protein [Dehalococcoidia bacterium]